MTLLSALLPPLTLTITVIAVLAWSVTHEH